ncbi:MAG: SLC13 family permease [Calditrichaceae bacterium]|nr:SLC13 family permease [Calditrichaceae bacterium]MBN2709515.1 SLC13 family permease [Calditrichaceae bacterium]RQV93123.1 MAG: SLC13 family permease [Calditrichota bacterium]
MAYIHVFIVLFLTLVLFAWGRFRHDFVALIALFTLVVLGIIPSSNAFTGFSHPAVITVAAVLVIGKALEYSGLIDLLGKWISGIGDNLTLQIFTLSLLVAAASAFMNNVGALAILMPVAIHIARKSGNPPSYLLMPIAFASLLGGMTTLIGTPPNIIIATLRANEAGEPFGMFSFAPVGIGLTIAGILFITLIGWRLLPKRTAKKSEEGLFKIEDYITEIKVNKNSKIKGITFAELSMLSKADVQILGLVRHNKRIHIIDENEELLENDIIIIEGDTESIKTYLDDTGLELAGGKKFRKDAVGSKEITINEAIVMADSPLIGQTTSGLRLRSRYGVNLLAVSRKQEKIHRRLDHIVFRTGDVLLLQGRAQMIDDTIVSMGCLPLARRGLRIGFEKKIALSMALFISSIVLVVSDILPVHISFSIAAIGMILTGVLPVKNLYTSIDWPVIVLLGAMLPVGEALETTGGATLIANQILHTADIIPIWALLSLLLTVTMLLSSVINNAATVVIMAPIGIEIALGVNFSIDPFLMTIAVGASAAFLTPIGHQSNTLVMGPGGYRFGDYFRMGLPITLIVIAVAVPLILYFWPV